MLLLAVFGCGETPREQSSPNALPPLPPPVREKLSTHLDATRGHPTNVWRDTPALNPDGTVNGYIEISRGESTKWEFRIPFNRREVDRMIPESLGGYPTNYGFIPQTVSYDGDPADVLVLGPAIRGGEVVNGRIVGLMRMMDTGDLDSKVVVSPPGEQHALDAHIQRRLSDFFNTYKRHEGKATEVTGWGDAREALRFLHTTAGFFSSAAQKR